MHEIKARRSPSRRFPSHRTHRSHGRAAAGVEGETAPYGVSRSLRRVHHESVTPTVCLSGAADILDDVAVEVGDHGRVDARNDVPSGLRRIFVETLIFS